MKNIESIKFLIDTVELLVIRAKTKIGTGRTRIQVVKDVLFSIGKVSQLNLKEINEEFRDLSIEETLELIDYMKTKGFAESVAQKVIEKIKGKKRATVFNLILIFLQRK